MAKIVHIISSLVAGGGQTMLLNLARESAKRHDVTIISLTDECELDVSDLNVIFLNKKSGLDIGMFFTLYKTLKKINPDVVHTHLYAAIYAFLWFWLSKKRHGVHTIHSDATRELKRPHMLVQKLLYRHRNVTPTAISATIRRQAQQLYGLPENKVALVYNAIDVDRFKFQNRNYDDMTAFTFVQVASFNPWKNQSMLLDAFCEAYKNDKRLRLVFVGDGPDRPMIEKCVHDRELCDVVEFLGKVSDVENVLKRCDAFVLSSVYEGLPMSVLEAYASALPVISTNVGGLSDILQNGINGYLIEPSALSLASAMIMLASSAELCKKISDNNLAFSEEFDIKRAAVEYENLYRVKG